MLLGLVELYDQAGAVLLAYQHVHPVAADHLGADEADQVAYLQNVENVEQEGTS